MERLEQIENLLAVMLQGATTQVGGLTLQGDDRLAVVEAQGQIIAAARWPEVEGQLQVELKPLALLPLDGQDAHMGPEPQLPDQDPIRWQQGFDPAAGGPDRAVPCSSGHRGKARWRNVRWPEA